MNYGSTFRKLRLYKGYNLEFVAKGIVSVSYLSKFERNESEITLPKILELLNRINVKFNEFIIINNEFKTDGLELLLENLRESYLQGNLKALNRLIDDENSKFKNTGLLTHKLNSIMIQAICLDLTQRKVEKKDIELLIDYLWKVEIWGEYEIILYGNTLHILEVDSVIMLSSELIKKSMLFKKMISYRRDMYGIFFNTIRVCLEYNKLKEVELYLNILKNEDIKETFILEKIILNFYDAIFKMHNQYDEGLAIAERCIHILEEVEAFNYALNYEEYLKKFIKTLSKNTVSY
ncbi:helix-turn-helix domain-containing protein [Lysinibacillus sphaericus]|uniref:Transcriptional activator, Rgg/GadR/MutR family, C-terminal domain protein n=1 Tax=Lysinibacillus sphaericus OT4b.31 TaxID=1285586 RepID=R7ZEW9_LYSSH|nr:Rgg/GadR/MutR family transcriptional regulator [Lysinibacillus sphaericus]EON72564.1 transcriptional activator, Rgg/GadR/MutR family, C-terminal domain protein [Lysinibacillus sphaericus OT4b.31]